MSGSGKKNETLRKKIHTRKKIVTNVRFKNFIRCQFILILSKNVLVGDNCVIIFRICLFDERCRSLYRLTFFSSPQNKDKQLICEIINCILSIFNNFFFHSFFFIRISLARSFALAFTLCATLLHLINIQMLISGSCQSV